MASPVGHAAVGLAVASVVARSTGTPDSAALWAGGLIACGLPDLDVVAQLLGLIGRRGHRNATHSLFASAAVILLALAAMRWLDLDVAPGLFLAWTAALLSHPLLDVVTTGPRQARLGWGIPLLWPLSRRRFHVRRPWLISDRDESHSFRDLLREAREDAVRIVPVGAAVVLMAELWRWLG